MARLKPAFLLLLLIAFSSCRKDSALQPLLPGVWESTGKDYQLVFSDGNFNVRYEPPGYGGSYSLYTGQYTMDGNSIYLTAQQLEVRDVTYMAKPITTKIQTAGAEHYKFWIRDGQLVFDLEGGNLSHTLLDPRTAFVKRN